MNRILLTLLSVFLSLNLFAGNVFTIFRVMGDVQRKRVSTSAWTSVHRRDTVKLSDRLSIPSGGEVRILESSSGVIYSFAGEGVVTVKEIIDRSKESTRHLLGAVTGELYQEIRSKSSTGESINSHGATSRGDNEDDKALEALHQRILQGDDSLYVALVQRGDTYRFVVTNRGNQCMVSILCIHPGEASFCLPAEGIAVKSGDTLLEEPEIIPVEGARYAVFRIDVPYEGGALLRLFRE